MSDKTPRDGYLFHPSECPNQAHPFTERCGLCGTDPRAQRFGENIAKGLFLGVGVIVAAGIARLVVLIVTGA